MFPWKEPWGRCKANLLPHGLRCKSLSWPTIRSDELSGFTWPFPVLGCNCPNPGRPYRPFSRDVRPKNWSSANDTLGPDPWGGGAMREGGSAPLSRTRVGSFVVEAGAVRWQRVQRRFHAAGADSRIASSRGVLAPSYQAEALLEDHSNEVPSVGKVCTPC